MTEDSDRTRRPFVLADAIDILARTPATLDALLWGLPLPWIAAHEGAETWSAFDIVGHLIHGEQTDWLPRAKIILEHGDARPFEPFDRLAQLESRPAARWRACSTSSPAFAAGTSRSWERWSSRPPTLTGSAAIRSLGR